MGWSACSVGQTTLPQTTLTQDNIIARKKLRVGLDTSKYWTSIVQTISAASTHRQGPTAKAVHDYCQSLLYSGGLGISVAGGVITNTGDVDPFDDITTDTEGEGDVAGFFPNLQVMGLRGVPISGTTPVTGNVYQYESGQWVPRSLGGDLSGQVQNAQIAANAVGTAEIANGSVSNSDLATVPGNTVKLRSAAGPGATTDFPMNTNSLLGMTDKIRAIGLSSEFEFSTSPLEISLAQQGAVSGQALKWNGTDWVPDDDEVGAPEIGTGTEPVWGIPAKVLETAGESVKIYLGEDATGAISGYTPPFGIFTVEVEGSVDDDFKKVRLSMGEGNVSVSRLNPGTGAPEGGTVLSPFSVNGPEQVAINTNLGSGSIIIGSAATGTGNTAKKINLNYPVQFWSYTTTERDAFTSVTAGTLIFNTTVGKMQCYDGSTWQNLW